MVTTALCEEVERASRRDVFHALETGFGRVVTEVPCVRGILETSGDVGFAHARKFGPCVYRVQKST